MGSPIRGRTVAGALLAAAVTVVAALPGSAGAQVFSPTRVLTTTAEGYQEPQVSALGNDVHVVWVDAATGNGDIYYRRSTDGGASFGPARNLSEEGITPEQEAGGVRVLAQGRHVYVTWVEGGLRFRSSDDRGTTFGPVLELTGYSEGGLRLAAGGGENVYMAWYRTLEDEQGDIYFVRSPVAGRVFADIENLSGNRNYGTVELAARGNHVYVVWDDFGSNDGSDLFFRRSTDAGITFEPTVQLTDTEDNSRDQQIAVHGNTVYVTWNECPWRCQVWLRRSTDAGVTFGAPVQVSQGLEDAFEPRLVVRDTRVFVAWTGQTADRYEAEIYLSLSVDGGATFGAPANVSGTPTSDSRGARLVPAGAGVRLVWTEGYNGERDVYTRATSGFGQLLGATENLSNTAEDSGRADIAYSRCGTQSHVVWLESTDAGNSVRYRRASLPFSSLYCTLLPEAR
jgi:hypothetical protein